MKSITQLQFGLQKLAVRLFGGVSTRADKQRGASALEYIVLAAAIIVIVGVLATVFGGDSNPLSDAFSNLFNSAQTP
ncbi:Flp family type IVb pilin [Alloalcanivorax sp. C16-1]|uniref:Flp family type IVb pilin n=1 Tax=Alloalcanivorax sp. C16-1 TaxID=3390051 RepID=UPI00397070F6